MVRPLTESLSGAERCSYIRICVSPYDALAQHQLHKYASSIGLAVLMQNVNGTWKPVTYYPRSTSSTEKHMHSYELETLSVVEALERFKYYIYSKPVKVRRVGSANSTLVAPHSRLRHRYRTLVRTRYSTCRCLEQNAKRRIL